MCSGNFAKCLGITLIPLAILCLLCNILLLFPGGKPAKKNEDVTDEAWYFGGIIGSGILVSHPILVDAFNNMKLHSISNINYLHHV